MDPQTLLPGQAQITSTTLLEGLKDPANRTVWQQYVDRYRPMIVRYAGKLGVPPDESEDIAQTTLMTFSRSYREGRYDREKGRLSSWLFGIARNDIRAWSRSRPAHAPSIEGVEAQARLVELEAEDRLRELWEQEWRDAILWQCLQLVGREVEDRTMRVFERFALEARSATEVARELGITENAVFGAKRRVLTRLRELLPLVEDAW